MEMKFILILFFLVLISVLLVALLCALFYIIFRNKNKSGPDINITEEAKTKEREEDEDLLEPILANCDVHKNERAVALCSVCKTSMCDHCVREDENIYFCSTHFKTYISSEWVELTSVRTTADSPEAGIHIYHFQESLWQKEKTPTYIVTHYKIDVTDDQIESHVKLMVRKEDKELLKNMFDTSLQ